ncbi:MAG: hypothetical protein ACYTAO_16430 [Planctomycetota bacterium]|jgi:hypothetical protein
MIISVDVNGDAVGADSLADVVGRTRAFPRVITGIALTGGSAIGDTGSDVFIENTKVATVYNSSTNARPNRDDIIPQNIPVPANAAISAPVVDAAPAACVLTLYTNP